MEVILHLWSQNSFENPVVCVEMVIVGDNKIGKLIISDDKDSDTGGNPGECKHA